MVDYFKLEENCYWLILSLDVPPKNIDIISFMHYMSVEVCFVQVWAKVDFQF